MEYGEEASHDPTEEEKVGIMGGAISLQIVSNTNTNSNTNKNTNTNIDTVQRVSIT